jgi:hypothetical protein
MRRTAEYQKQIINIMSYNWSHYRCKRRVSILLFLEYEVGPLVKKLPCFEGTFCLHVQTLYWRAQFEYEGINHLRNFVICVPVPEEFNLQQHRCEGLKSRRRVIYWRLDRKENWSVPSPGEAATCAVSCEAGSLYILLDSADTMYLYFVPNKKILQFNISAESFMYHETLKKVLKSYWNTVGSTMLMYHETLMEGFVELLI